MGLFAFPTTLANTTATNEVMRAYIVPTMLMLGGLAALVCTFFIVIAGYQYITSRGTPDRLEHAKKVLKNALIGLVIVFGAGTLTAVLSNAYSSTAPNGVENIPALETLEQPEEDLSIVDILIKAIVGLFKHIIETAASPFLKALDYFTRETPLMADNQSVFKLWLTMVVIADALFVLVLALIGFHVMSSTSLGFDEVDIKSMAPQLVLIFLFINTSIFFIDLIISLSNVLIKAIEAAYSSISVWDVLSKIADNSGGMGLVALMIMVAFIVLSIMLLIYYVLRLVTLYIGAVLSPMVGLLAILPGFKDFAITVTKVYLTTIFVLFIHIIILQLAASLFAGTITNAAEPNTLMAVIVGIATLLALLKTQNLMMQMTYVSAGPRALRKLGGEFMKGISYTTNRSKPVQATQELPAINIRRVPR